MYPRFLQCIINEQYPYYRQDGIASDRFQFDHMSARTFEALLRITGSSPCHTTDLLPYMRMVARGEIAHREEDFHLSAN